MDTYESLGREKYTLMREHGQHIEQEPKRRKQRGAWYRRALRRLEKRLERLMRRGGDE